MSEMHVLYIPHTDHVVAAHYKSGTATPTPASLVGEAGLCVGGIRGAHPVAMGANNWRTPTSEQEQLWIPQRELAVRTLPVEQGALTCPYGFVVDGAQVAQLPQSFRLGIAIENGGADLVLRSPMTFVSLTFPAQTRVWAQVEGPRAVDRRIMAKTIPAGHTGNVVIPLTVDTEGPLAGIPVGSSTTYYVLVLVEGRMPDARTQVL